MLINQSIVADIKAIIAQSKDNAIRAIDHQRTLMYWQKNKKGKIEQIMVNTL